MSNGRYLGTSQHGHLYEFRLESETFVPGDCGIELEVSKQRYPGSVVALEGFDITLELEERLDPVPFRAVLIVKLWYILDDAGQTLHDPAAMQTWLSVSSVMAMFA